MAYVLYIQLYSPDSDDIDMLRKQNKSRDEVYENNVSTINK